MVSRKQILLTPLPLPAQMPEWLDESNLAVLVSAFVKSGFQGGPNYYRNLDRNRELMAAFDGSRVEAPALFLVGERDTSLAMLEMRSIIEAMPALVPRLVRSVTI